MTLLQLSEAHIIGAVISFLTSIFFVPAVIYFSEKKGLVDNPGGRKIHDHPVPRLGGVGPFLPQRRKALGYNEPNDAPLYKLVTAYRRVDKGTKCLFAPNDLAKRYAAEFYKDKPDYIEDTKWWKAAQEEDEKNWPDPRRLDSLNERKLFKS